jgi:hypothetical protein
MAMERMYAISILLEPCWYQVNVEYMTIFGWVENLRRRLNLDISDSAIRRTCSICKPEFKATFW